MSISFNNMTPEQLATEFRKQFKISQQHNGLPDPLQTHYSRSPFTAEGLHDACNAVSKAYEGKPVVTIYNGDARGKDTFFKACVDIEAALSDDVPAKDVLDRLTKTRPAIRRDLHPDDLASKTIQYTQKDNKNIERDIAQEVSPLTRRAALRAKNFLTKKTPVNDRVPLSGKLLAALGPLEQVDIAKPLSPDKKVKIPSVHSAQEILHYLTPKEQKQFAINLQETQQQGSYLIVGPTEAKFLTHLPDLFQRHGYMPDSDANEKMHRLKTKAFGPEYLGTETLDSQKFVYRKTEL